MNEKVAYENDNQMMTKHLSTDNENKVVTHIYDYIA